MTSILILVYYLQMRHMFHLLVIIGTVFMVHRFKNRKPTPLAPLVLEAEDCQLLYCRVYPKTVAVPGSVVIPESVAEAYALALPSAVNGILAQRPDGFLRHDWRWLETKIEAGIEPNTLLARYYLNGCEHVRVIRFDGDMPRLGSRL